MHLIDRVVDTLLHYRGRLPNHPLVTRLGFGALRKLAWIGGVRRSKDFEQVENFCLFVGHGRTGHTLVGALLDAHPAMVISHELNALDLIERGMTRKELYYLILCRSRHFARNAQNAGYEYSVPAQYKGEYESIRVIGDKKGGPTTMLLSQKPHLIKNIKEKVNANLKIVQVTRHPLDCIPTIAQKTLGSSKHIDDAIELYFERCSSISKIRSTYEVDWFDLYFENFVRKTKKSLSSLCRYLGVKCSREYLKDCSEIVFEEPKTNREKVSWSKKQIELIGEETKRYSFLSEYRIG